MTCQGTFFATGLSRCPVIAILRGASEARTVELGRACWDAGVNLVEVAFSDDQVPAGLIVLAEEGRARGLPIGAGSVTSSRRLDLAVQAGASFAVAPGLDRVMVEAAEAAGIPFLPGVATASEIGLALGLGCKAMKVFPAASLGTQWLRAIRQPFPQAALVAVGGVNVGNAEAMMTAGAMAIGVGSGLDNSLGELIAAAERGREIAQR